MTPAQGRHPSGRTCSTRIAPRLMEPRMKPVLLMLLALAMSCPALAEGAVFRNNTFYVEGVALYGHGVRRADDGKYAMEPGWGQAKAIGFEGNQYIGRHMNAPEDAKARRESSAAPKLDWNGPQFDPANPDGFDTFLDAHRKWMTRLFEQQFGKPVRLGR
jgi:hypothetical protein